MKLIKSNEILENSVTILNNNYMEDDRFNQQKFIKINKNENLSINSQVDFNFKQMNKKEYEDIKDFDSSL